jgi:hypothetical protein
LDLNARDGACLSPRSTRCLLLRSMNRSRTFVKKGRTSTAAIVEELQAAAIPDSETADALWKLVDKNNDGMLSRAEFAHAISVIKKQAADQVAEKVELEAGLLQSKRRSNLLCAIVAFMTIMIGILLAGNTGLVYGLLEMTKETKVEGGVLFAKSGGNVISTAEATFRVNATNLVTLSDDLLYSVQQCYFMRSLQMFPNQWVTMRQQIPFDRVVKITGADVGGDPDVTSILLSSRASIAIMFWIGDEFTIQVKGTSNVSLYGGSRITDAEDIVHSLQYYERIVQDNDTSFLPEGVLDGQLRKRRQLTHINGILHDAEEEEDDAGDDDDLEFPEFETDDPPEEPDDDDDGVPSPPLFDPENDPMCRHWIMKIFCHIDNFIAPGAAPTMRTIHHICSNLDLIDDDWEYKEMLEDFCSSYGLGNQIDKYVLSRRRELDNADVRRKLTADEVDNAMFDMNAGTIGEAWCTGTYHH